MERGLICARAARSVRQVRQNPIRGKKLLIQVPQENPPVTAV
jgi:hypothetical protein